MSAHRYLRLAEAANVGELKQRDRFVRRVRKIRAGVVLDKNTIEHWNRVHPNERPISTTFEDQVIAWCDGNGPLPLRVPDEAEP